MTDYKLVQAELIDWLTQNEEKVLDGTFPKFHAILADPPYALPGGFMNKKWDQFSSPQAYQAWVTEWASLLLKFVYPGAVGMFFGGTRTVHRLTSGLEDAGWEIADCLMYLYGSGFPKSHDISKAIDRAAGAERAIVGEYAWPDGKPRNTTAHTTHRNGIYSDIRQNGENDRSITAPATPDAARWSGWGTSLKPSYEPLIVAQKPLTDVPHRDIIIQVNGLLGGALCLLLSSANDAASVLTLSPVGPSEVSVSVATLAALLHGHTSGALSEKMDTFNSPGMVSTCLNIALSWNAILGAHLNHGSTYTTSTATAVITALKTLQSFLSEIMPVSIILGEMMTDGYGSSVINAGKSSTADDMSKRPTPKPFAAELATWRTAESGTPANTAANALRPIIPSVCSVLNDVMTLIGINTAGGTQSAIGPLSPDFLPVILARAPRDGTYAQCATKYGTSALNVDGGRISAGDEALVRPAITRLDNEVYGKGLGAGTQHDPAGRWPANVILDDVAAAALDAQVGERPAGGAVTGNEPSYTGKTGIYGTMGRQKWEPYQDGGGPSRFFYTSKASTWERTAGMDERSNHPTVKPADLTRYLATMLLPPELDESRRILVPFAGIGSEMLGAILAGWDSVVGIEQSEDYITQAYKRLAWWSQFDSIEAAKKAYQQEQKRAKEVVEWFTS